MGGRGVWIFIVLSMTGCTWNFGPKSSPPVIEHELVQCPEVSIQLPKTETQSDLVVLRNKCFEGMEEREAIIAGLRKDLENRSQEIESLKNETDYWKKKYYDSTED